MTYQRGMNLESWVDEHAGFDVIVRRASIVGEFDEEGEYIPGPPDFGDLEEETGRLIGVVDGLLYLDLACRPDSMPPPEVIRAIRDFTAKGVAPWLGIMAGEGGVAAPHYVDPSLVAEIELDHEGIGRQRAEAQRLESEREWQFFHHLVDTQPCYLCGRMVQRGREPYDILGPDSGWGEEEDPDYIPCDSTWKVVCFRHE